MSWVGWIIQIKSHKSETNYYTNILTNVIQVLIKTKIKLKLNYNKREKESGLLCLDGAVSCCSDGGGVRYADEGKLGCGEKEPGCRD